MYGLMLKTGWMRPLMCVVGILMWLFPALWWLYCDSLGSPGLLLALPWERWGCTFMNMGRFVTAVAHFLLLLYSQLLFFSRWGGWYLSSIFSTWLAKYCTINTGPWNERNQPHWCVQSDKQGCILRKFEQAALKKGIVTREMHCLEMCLASALLPHEPPQAQSGTGF